MRVLIIPDKLKGTLTAEGAARAIARGWRKSRPQDDLDLLPMSDGGDGFGQVMSRLLKATPVSIKTRDAAHRSCNATWWWEPKTKTGIVESANIIGLAMLPPKQFHPFDLDTFGLANVLRAVAAKGARRCLVGIGGSATNDGGFGFARGLGWKFLNRNGHEIEHWTGLRELAEIQQPKTRRLFRELLVAVDVQNPLLGARGASRIYGPQKGLQVDHFAVAEGALTQLARVARKTFGQDFARQPGAGAAGGLGFGLLSFAGGRLESGFELFAHYAKLNHRLRQADLVITAEGAMDRSTLMGKGAGQVARRARELKIPCFGLAGVAEAKIRRLLPFAKLQALTALTTIAKAKAEPAFWLERLAEKVSLEV